MAASNLTVLRAEIFTLIRHFW